MGKLCIADIDRWDTGAIAHVFGISTNIADHSLNTSGKLGTLSVFETWNSDAAVAAHKSVGVTRKDLDRHGDIATKVGEAARKAEQEVQDVKNSLKKLRADIAAAGFVLDPHTDVISDPHPERTECMSDEAAKEYIATLGRLNFELAAVLTAADCADHDLATAIRNADGDWNIVQWKPSKADLIMGSAGAISGTKTDIIQEIWRASMGEHPTGIDAKIAPWLEEVGKLRVSRAGGAFGVLTAIPSVFADRAEGNSWGEAITREGAATATGLVAGAYLGAQAGAVAGTFVPLPGVGTAAGLVVGATVGFLASYATSKGVDSLWR
ncbi:hypothetical protein [Gordonia hankookensis]|uniref:Uncharacterized protein n=1 Tax=Gordonia hankookensis TaxID=589403 RepID=A0ABR7WD33_9ACTN|nr:hypothetical protein [Gordonia hankookensis]MBD1320550.1 hypothetical protein [Gordonia hankookensis]